MLPDTSAEWFIREIILWDRLGNTSNYISLDIPLYDRYISFLNLDDEFYFLYNYDAVPPVQTWVPTLSIELTD